MNDDEIPFRFSPPPPARPRKSASDFSGFFILVVRLALVAILSAILLHFIL